MAAGPSPAAKDLRLRARDGTRLSCQVLSVLLNRGGAKGMHGKAMDPLRELVPAQTDVPPE